MDLRPDGGPRVGEDPRRPGHVLGRSEEPSTDAETVFWSRSIRSTGHLRRRLAPGPARLDGHRRRGERAKPPQGAGKGHRLARAPRGSTRTTASGGSEGEAPAEPCGEDVPEGAPPTSTSSTRIGRAAVGAKRTDASRPPPGPGANPPDEEPFVSSLSANDVRSDGPGVEDRRGERATREVAPEDLRAVDVPGEDRGEPPGDRPPGNHVVTPRTGPGRNVSPGRNV